MIRTASYALVVLVLLANCGSATKGPIDESIDIGTHELHIYCLGEGSPIIVNDVGAGETYASWESLQERLAEETRVCAYDRAGYGQSDAGPMPRDGQQQPKSSISFS